MNREEMKREFPAMPEDIRAMVENEVKKQVNAPTRPDRCPVRKLSRTLLIAAAMVVVLTVAAVAKGGLIQLRGQPEGEYALNVAVKSEETAEIEDAAQAASVEETVVAAELMQNASVSLPRPRITAGWLPEGMSLQPTDNVDYYYVSEDASMMIYPMTLDVYAEDVELLHTGVIRWEELDINGDPAICVEQQFGKIILCRMFEEEGYILELTGLDMEWDDLIHVGEELILETEDLDRNVRAQTWSEYAAIRFESEASSEMDESLRVMAEELNVHAVGEAFPVWYEDDAWNPLLDDLMARVVSVEVADTVNSLDPEYFPVRWEESVGEDGTLKTNVLEYYASGDGVKTLTQLGLTEEVDQKCVTATVEYTNTGSVAVDMVLLNAGPIFIEKMENGYAVYDRVQSKGYDYAEATGAYFYDGLEYYDVRSERSDSGPNYIDHLEPGESVTIQMAWIVNEDELDKMYLNLGSINRGDKYFSDYDMQVGYVDIRQ